MSEGPAGARQVWREGGPAARRAMGWVAATLLLAGLPFVGLALGVVAVVVSRRAREAERNPATDEPSRLASLAVLLAVLGTLLAGFFTLVLAVLLVLPAG